MQQLAEDAPYVIAVLFGSRIEEMCILRQVPAEVPAETPSCFVGVER